MRGSCVQDPEAQQSFFAALQRAKAVSESAKRNSAGELRSRSNEMSPRPGIDAAAGLLH